MASTYTREDRAVGDEQVFGNSRISDNDEKLVSEPERVQWAEFLVPIVEHTFRVMREKRERSCQVNAASASSPFIEGDILTDDGETDRSIRGGIAVFIVELASENAERIVALREYIKGCK